MGHEKLNSDPYGCHSPVFPESALLMNRFALVAINKKIQTLFFIFEMQSFL